MFAPGVAFIVLCTVALAEGSGRIGEIRADSYKDLLKAPTVGQLKVGWPAPDHNPNPCNLKAPMQVCDEAGDDILLIYNKTPFANARCVCLHLGLELADVSGPAFAVAAERIFSCLGQDAKVWVGSGLSGWGDCQRIEIGDGSPGSWFSGMADCGEEAAVLCRKRSLPEFSG